MAKKYLLDTNIIVRLAIKDDPKLFSLAKEIFVEIETKKAVGFISILVLDETIWVLENYYELERRVYIPILKKILALRNIKILEVSKSSIEVILHKMEASKIDFTDYYLMNYSNSFVIKSFDKDLMKL